MFLTPKGRLLKNKLVPRAEEVNQVAVRGVAATDIVATRRTLLAILENLARDEVETENNLRVPSTRELARRASKAFKSKRTRIVKRA